MAPDLIAPVRARLPDIVVTLEAAAGFTVRASALEASGEVLPVHAFLLSYWYMGYTELSAHANAPIIQANVMHAPISSMMSFFVIFLIMFDSPFEYHCEVPACLIH